MRFERIHLESLGHASYLVASDGTGDPLGVDPRRDVDVYLDVAHERDYRIRTTALNRPRHKDIR